MKLLFIAGLFTLASIQSSWLVTALGSKYTHDGETTYCWKIPHRTKDTALTEADRTELFEGYPDCPIKMTITLPNNTITAGTTINVEWSLTADFSQPSAVGNDEITLGKGPGAGEIANIVHSNVHSCIYNSGCDPFNDGEELVDKTSNQIANFTNGAANFKDKIKFTEPNDYSVLAHIILPYPDDEEERFDYAVYTKLTVEEANSNTKTPVIIEEGSNGEVIIIEDDDDDDKDGKSSSSSSVAKTKQSSGSSFPVVAVILGVIAGVAVIALIIFIMGKKKKDDVQQSRYEPPQLQSVSTAKNNNTNNDAYSMAETDTQHSLASMLQTRKAFVNSNSSNTDNSLDEKTIQLRHSQILESLSNNEIIQSKRIPLDNVTVVKPLSKGAYGEVYLCSIDGQMVAAKCLLASKHRVKDLEDFAAEIQLTGSLDHPNIIRFVGVAYTNVDDMCMFMEYCPKGELYEFLQTQGDLISWIREKLPMATGIAKALAYLHSKEPRSIIHRDLKTRNVLLTQNLDVKLIDFGVSRAQIEETMTAGIGTPYWTAPEVLDSQRYTEKSDIYSFGIFLSELDTCEIPYHDIRTETGERMAPLRILHKVMNGELTPSFTPDCPPRIINIAKRCVKINPAERPTAAEIVEVLTGTRKQAANTLQPRNLDDGVSNDPNMTVHL